MPFLPWVRHSEESRLTASGRRGILHGPNYQSEIALRRLTDRNDIVVLLALPIRERAVGAMEDGNRPELLRDFREQFQGFCVELHAEARPPVRPHLAVLKIVTHRQMRLAFA